MNNQRNFLRICFVLIAFGAFSLLAFISGSAWASLRAVDIVRLTGIGMCFGGAIFSFVAYLIGRRSS